MAEKQRYFLELAYRGTAFHGWQKQPHSETVQGKIEEMLGMILRTETEVIGCGRTDTGVHASRYFAHFDAVLNLEPEILLQKLNSLAAPNIGFRSLKAVGAEAHSRFNASQRQYRYRLHFGHNPFLHGLSWRCHFKELDPGLMQEGASALLEFEDFASFCKTNSDVKTTLCKLYHSQWEFGDDEWHYVIRANRFLRGMVRLITGSLLDLGRGKISMEDFKAGIAAGERFHQAASVPPEGLYLEEVIYPDDLWTRH